MLKKFGKKQVVIISAIVAIVVVAVIIAVLFFPTAKKPLALKQEVWVTPTGNSWAFKNVVDFNVEEKDIELSAISSNEEIVVIEDDKMVVGKKFGTAKVTISSQKKESVLTVKVVPYFEYMQHGIDTETNETVKKGKMTEMLLCKWFIFDLDAFKNPKSVEVLMTFTFFDENNEVDYFIVKARAENSFGGNTVDFYEVKNNRISMGFNPLEYPDFIIGDYEVGSGYALNRILDDYRNGVNLIMYL